MATSDADALAAEAASLDGYFSDAPLTPEPQYPPLNESFDTAIVITNLPTVGAAKIEKLTKVVTKLVSRIGALAASDDFTGVYLPIDEAKDESFGFAICEYATKEEARQAVEVLQGYKVRAIGHMRMNSACMARQGLTFITRTGMRSKRNNMCSKWSNSMHSIIEQ